MRRFLVLSVGVIVAACSGGSPTRPSARVTHTPAAGDSTAGALHNPNSPPALELRTTPRQVNGVVAGPLPLDVKINLCKTSDPDEGDSLKFNVNWGDGVQTGQHHPGAGTDVGDGGPPTGCGGPGCCRHRHRFDSAGAFTVTAEVSDKHLEDQSGDVSALAISTATFVVKAGSAPEATPTPVPTCAASGGPCTAFVTSTLYTGNLGGVSGADAICQTHADNAGLQGTFKAWISDNLGSSPSTTFTQNPGPYVFVGGRVVANNWADLTDGTIGERFNGNELGVGVSTHLWSNTNTDGTSFGGVNCSNWTSASASVFGWHGSSCSGCKNSKWTLANSPSTGNVVGPLKCDNSSSTGIGRVACFEQ